MKTQIVPYCLAFLLAFTTTGASFAADATGSNDPNIPEELRVRDGLPNLPLADAAESPLVAPADKYAFDKTISRVVLENYLGGRLRRVMLIESRVGGWAAI